MSIQRSLMWLRLCLMALPLGCGPSSPPASPDAPGDAHTSPTATSTADAPPPPTATATADAPKAPPSNEPSAVETLARDLLKAGGRRIGYSATKKGFVFPKDARVGAGRGLDLIYTDEEGHQKDIQRVCQPGECEEKLDEIVKEITPKLVERLTRDGYEAIFAIGWPPGDEAEIRSIGLKLKYTKGKLEQIKDKKSVALKSSKPLKAASIMALYPTSNGKLLGVIAEGDLYVYKLP